MTGEIKSKSINRDSEGQVIARADQLSGSGGLLGLLRQVEAVSSNGRIRIRRKRKDASGEE